RQGLRGIRSMPSHGGLLFCVGSPHPKCTIPLGSPGSERPDCSGAGTGQGYGTSAGRGRRACIPDQAACPAILARGDRTGRLGPPAAPPASADVPVVGRKMATRTEEPLPLSLTAPASGVYRLEINLRADCSQRRDSDG